ncbi:MAG TPA: hypothetical protein VK716_05705 [Terracidiphilus sp.]|jgi:hypothetical protein|nr:hypothetical protein [Terracidiphilus sp.]
MRIHAYIRVVSDETVVRAIDHEAKLREAVVKETKAPKNNGSGAMWWNWNTPRVLLDANDPDAGLKKLLAEYRAIFPIIRKQSGPDCVTYLQLVTEYEKTEEPRGLYLSNETIVLINEMGGSLDNDVVLHE